MAGVFDVKIGLRGAKTRGVRFRKFCMEESRPIAFHSTETRGRAMPKAVRKVVKVLLLQDVYKLGRAGEVKEVARGYARNFLIPQGLATVATPQALRMAERIRERAEKERAEATARWQSVAERIAETTLYFPVRASETGKLYGSVSQRMIAQALSEELGVEISHRQVDTDPIRFLGEYEVPVRLTIDLIPKVKVVVHRMGEGPEAAQPEAEATPEAQVESEGQAGEAVGEPQPEGEPERA